MEELLIYNAEIWPLDGGSPIKRGWLTARQGKISGIGNGSPNKGTRAKREVDAQGRSLLPGLVDCHTHLMEYAAAEVNQAQGRGQRMAAVANLLTALQSGIVATGEHHLGHPVLAMPMKEYREILTEIPMNSALAFGCCWLGFEPRVFTSATRPGESFPEEALSDGEYEAMAEASEFPGENLFLNYTCANAPLEAAPNAGGVTYTREKLQHIVDLFHKKGKKIGAHIEGDASARLFIQCGGDVIHHGHNLSPDLGKLLAEKGTALVLTPAAGTSKRPTSPEETLAFYRQGVFLALASDSYIYPHPEATWIPLAKERLAGPQDFLAMTGSTLRYLAEKGVSREEILRLITVNPRRLLHPKEEEAVLRPGRPADLILCSGLPGLETEKTEDIVLVITQGEIQIDKGA